MEPALYIGFIFLEVLICPEFVIFDVPLFEIYRRGIKWREVAKINRVNHESAKNPSKTSVQLCRSFNTNPFSFAHKQYILGTSSPADSNNEVVLLFLMLRSGEKLDDKLRSELCAALRKRVSPRHVPDEIHVIDDIPYTSNGKKVELAVKQVLNGDKVLLYCIEHLTICNHLNQNQVEKTSALRNPEALDYFLPFAVNSDK